MTPSPTPAERWVDAFLSAYVRNTCIYDMPPWKARLLARTEADLTKPVDILKGVSGA